MKRLLLLTLGSLLLLAACQPAPPDTAATAATPAPATRPAPPVAPPRPRFEGTYVVTDTACGLSITITRRDTSYFYVCKKEDARGPVEVYYAPGDPEPGLTFVGLKGAEDMNVSCLWQDSVLLIQNYGNSMNEYNFFPGCGEKYLTFRRQ